MSSEDGFSRRAFLRQFGLGGVALSSLLAEQGLGAVAPRAGHGAGRAKNVIFLFMCGGASHLETFDFKPALRRYEGKSAAEVFSAEDLAGFNPEKSFEGSRILPPVFDFQQHGECGAWVSEIYPRLSEVVDEIAFIKSVQTDSAIHSVGETLMHTGHGRPGFPSLGSWVTYGLGSESSELPSYVVMKDGIPTAGDGVFQQGMLPGRHQAAVAKVGAGQSPFPHLEPHVGTGGRKGRERLEVLNRLNRLHLERSVGQPGLEGRIEAFEMAYKMQTAAPAVFDLSREPRSVRALYGDSPFAQHCLTARRLVESGVRFVEILDGAEGRKWDAHGNRGGLIGNHRSNAARTDQGIAGLITDLKSRGLLDETLVVWAMEFGRTPFEEERKKKSELGRGHHHKGFTLWMAGGGVKGGVSYGATDPLGMHAVEKPVSYHDFHATILYLLGLDHERLTLRHNSRDVRLTDVFGNVIEGVIA
ncbi:MAG: DUF1501 domain-containing protein [Verrucomicrobiales bacterium]|nr:DUF1501 domain-containing protein [Verrucomicrobiales bacterium]